MPKNRGAFKKIRKEQGAKRNEKGAEKKMAQCQRERTSMVLFVSGQNPYR